MSKQKLDIGSLYRKAAEGFKPTPSARVWDGVSKNLPGASAGGSITSLIKPALWTVAAASVIFVAAILWFDAEKDSISMDQPIRIDSEMVDKTPPIPEVIKEKEDEATEVVPAEEKAEEKGINDVIEKPAVAAEDKTPPLESKAPEEMAPVKQIAQEKVIETPEKDTESTKNSEADEDEQDSAWDRHRIQRGERNLHPSPKVSYSKEQTICKGESIKIGASNGLAYEWTDGRTSDSILVSPDYTSIYHLTIVRTDNRKVSTDIRVNVRECSNLFIPNAFTPNGDGKNDDFRIYGNHIIEYRMIIQSVEGTVLYESEDIEDAWDGTYAGQIVKTGTYLYHIDYIDAFGNSEVENGRITVIR